MRELISIIDLFAGPGGLGEGFSALETAKNIHPFKIKLSIEKDVFAHQTLELRAFYRQFRGGGIPDDYYKYLHGEINRTELFNNHPEEASSAESEAWLAELGVTPNDLIDSRIRSALEGSRNWVLIGGPPCQAYSLVGRSRMRGANVEEYEKDPRHFLYKEYLRILAAHQPPIFVMENVKGLLSSTINKQKTFDLILADLRSPSRALNMNSADSVSYKLFSISHRAPDDSEDVSPEDFVIHSEDYGIPQARHRIIILGIRADVCKSNPGKLGHQTEQMTTESAIGDLPPLRSGLSKDDDNAVDWRNVIREMESTRWFENLPLDLKKALKSNLKKIRPGMSRGASFIPLIVTPMVNYEWYVDDKLGGVCNHETRAHIREDLYRYFFAAVYAKVKGRSPTLIDFPKNLLPNHENVQEALTDSKFNDRFRVQVGGKPSTTVVSHISKDGHYYIHYDPAQCRSLTVREAARLQTFPDNYFFEGNRTQQYHQVGNAVPPLLARQIASIVYDVLSKMR